MTDEAIKWTVWGVTTICGLTIFGLRWLKNKKEENIVKAKEQSVGETRINEIEKKLEDASEDRAEIRKEFREHKIEVRDTMHGFLKNRISDIDEEITRLERLNKNK